MRCINGSCFVRSRLPLQPAFLVPLLPLAFFILYPRFYARLYAGVKKGRVVPPKSMKLVSRVSLFLSLLAGLLIALSALAIFTEYRTVSQAYHRGAYQIVQGQVNHFHPADPHNPIQKEKAECFTINQVKFSYSGSAMTTGYNTPRALGGVITGNGQRLKIGYVTLQDGQNRIVSIEALP